MALTKITGNEIQPNLVLSGTISADTILTTARPAFLAVINSSTDATVTVGTPIAADITRYNIGNCYNTTTYRFTAPIPGLYNFTVGIYFTASNSQTQRMQVGFRKNGSAIVAGSDVYAHIVTQPNNFTDKVCQFVLTAQFLLAAEDYIDVRPRTNSLRHYQGHYWFQGYLIG